MNKLDIAIIGAGWFGKYHLETCLKEKDINVVAMVCTNSAKLKPIMQDHEEIHFYNNYTELFTREDHLDAIIVAIPPDCHNNIEKEAANRNIALFMEKPLGIDRNTVIENERIINKSNIITSIGYHTRYNPAIETLKEYLKYHKPCTVSIKWVDAMPQTPWWRIKERSGGQIIEQVTHYIDTIRYLIGDIEACSGFSRNDLNEDISNFTNDSASVVALKFKNNTIGTLECGCYKTISSEKETFLTIHTKDSICHYNWNGDVVINDEIIPGIPVDEIYRQELRTFFNAVATSNPHNIKCDYSEGVKTFLTTLIIEKSLHNTKKLSIF